MLDIHFKKMKWNHINFYYPYTWSIFYEFHSETQTVSSLLMEFIYIPFHIRPKHKMLSLASWSNRDLLLCLILINVSTSICLTSRGSEITLQRPAGRWGLAERTSDAWMVWWGNQRRDWQGHDLCVCKCVFECTSAQFSNHQ